MAINYFDCTHPNEYPKGLVIDGKRLTVVFVDDELDYWLRGNAVKVNVDAMLGLIGKAFPNIEIDVLLFNEPSQAITLLQDQNLGRTVLFSDYNMPNINGVQLIKKFREWGFEGLAFILSGLANMVPKEVAILDKNKPLKGQFSGVQGGIAALLAGKLDRPRSPTAVSGCVCG